MLISGAIVVLTVIYFILAFIFKLPPFSKKEEEIENVEETDSTLLSSPVSLQTMTISGSTEESETSGYTMTSYYDIETVNPLLRFKVDFNVPNDSAVLYITKW